MSASRTFSGNFDGADETARREFASNSSYMDYVAVVRTFDADQAFWFPTIARDTDRGDALILETRLGTLSTRLSPYFNNVISWHASAEAAANTRRRIDNLNIRNVRIVVAENPVDLDLDEKKLGAIIFYGLSDDLTGQWKDDAKSHLDYLVRKAPQWLADGGALVIGENNRSSYWWRMAGHGAHDGRRGVKLPGLRKRIGKCLPYTELYVCSSPVTSGLTPPPDFQRHEISLEGSILPGGWVARAKHRILDSRPGRLFWPSFLVVASNRPLRSFLQGVLESQELSGAMGWNKTDKPVVKRIVAGNLSTSVIIAGPPDHELKNVVIRLSSGAAAHQRCRINVRGLKRLAQTSLSDRVPRLVGEGASQGYSYTLETGCSGFELNMDARSLPVMARQGLEVINRLCRETGKMTKITEKEFQGALAPAIQDLSRFCVPDVQERLGRLTRVLQSASVECVASRGYTHGDFKSGNLLFDRARNLTAIIDWDGFSEDGYQIFDLLTFLVYGMAYESGRGFSEVYVEHILPWELPPSYARLVDEMLPELTGDGKSFLFMRIIFWFVLLSARFDPIYKHHETWQRKYLWPVLPSLEAALSLLGGTRDIHARASADTEK